MKETYLKYAIAATVTLFAGIAFAFDFPLRAKEFPQLAMLMLAVIARVIPGRKMAFKARPTLPQPFGNLHVMQRCLLSCSPQERASKTIRKLRVSATGRKYLPNICQNPIAT